jgi:hypothetical protein
MATGTDGVGGLRLDRALTKPMHSGRPRLITHENAKGVEATESRSQKSLPGKKFENECDDVRADEEKLPRQDSNLDKENQNLLVALSIHLWDNHFRV